MKRNIYSMAVKALNEMKKSIEPGGTKILFPQYNVADSSLSRRMGSNQVLAVGSSDNIHHVPLTICSAGLYNRHLIHKDLAIDFIAVLTMDVSVDESLARRFIQWFINESPYSPCIVTNSVDTAYTKGIIIDASYPANLAVGAVIAYRRLWEYSEIVKSWDVMTKEGMDTNAAFAVAHNLNVTDRRIRIDTNSSHTTFSGHTLTDSVIKNFANGVQESPAKPYSEIKDYMNIHTLWGSCGNVVCSLFQDSADAIEVKGEVVVPNPFAATLNLAKDKVYDYKDHMKSLVKVVNNIVGEVNA